VRQAHLGLAAPCLGQLAGWLLLGIDSPHGQSAARGGRTDDQIACDRGDPSNDHSQRHPHQQQQNQRLGGAEIAALASGYPARSRYPLRDADKA
jgi:hypothetical protein